MSEDNRERKYTVVDRRSGGDAEADVGSGAPGQEAKRPEPEAIATQPERDSTGRTPVGESLEEDFDDGETGGTFNPVSLALSLLREQAMVNLGMLSHPKMADKRPNLEGAEEAARLFRKILKKFPDQAPLETDLEDDRDMSAAETLIAILSLLRSQTFVQLGLLPNPATGLAVKDLTAAKLTIDLFRFLLDEAKDRMDARFMREMEGVLADLQMNYVNQLGM